MKAKKLKTEFQGILKSIAPDLTKLLPEDGIRAMLKFYQDERVDHCELEDDGDMLLFQWGEYDYQGTQKFSLNITRQILKEDDEPYQLQLTFYFNETLAALEAGDAWCSNLEEMDAFLNIIDTNPAFNYYSK